MILNYKCLFVVEVSPSKYLNYYHDNEQAITSNPAFMSLVFSTLPRDNERKKQALKRYVDEIKHLLSNKALTTVFIDQRVTDELVGKEDGLINLLNLILKQKKNVVFFAYENMDRVFGEIRSSKLSITEEQLRLLSKTDDHLSLVESVFGQILVDMIEYEDS